MPLSHSLARQEQQSQLGGRAECRPLEHRTSTTSRESWRGAFPLLARPLLPNRLEFGAGTNVLVSCDSTEFGTLWTPRDGLTKAGVAYGQIYNWIADSTLTTPCSANGTVWTCGLTPANGSAAQAIWDKSQTCSGGGAPPAPGMSHPPGPTTRTSPEVLTPSRMEQQQLASSRSSSHHPRFDIAS
jgi:hypothetical protein